MEQIQPETENAPAYGFLVRPGWIYDKSSSTYKSGDDTGFMGVTELPPCYEFKIYNNDSIPSLVRSVAFENAQWVAEYNKSQNVGTVLVKGTKVVERRGVYVERSKEHYIAKSVYHNYHIDMLIHFSEKLDYDAEHKLKTTLDKMASNTSYNLLPPFKKAYIFPDKKNSQEVNATKHGLSEFIRVLQDSEVSKYPSTVTVLKPLSVSYSGIATPASSDQQEQMIPHQTGSYGCQPQIPTAGDTNETPNNNRYSSAESEYDNNMEVEEEYTVISNPKMTAKTEGIELDGDMATDKNSDPNPLYSGRSDSESQRSVNRNTPVGDAHPLRDTSVNRSNKQVFVEPETQTQDYQPVVHKSTDLASTFKQPVENDNLCGTSNYHNLSKSSKDDKARDLASTLLVPIEEENICGMTKKYYGVKSSNKEKVILMLGASGSGKTTLVNFIANYFRGTKKADGKLVHVEVSHNDAKSATKTITAYTFCPTLDDTPITFIDTPGLNDSSGAEVRDHVLALKTFLANRTSRNLEIHAIGFVAQAHLVRLTSSERLVMDYISTLFGEGSKEHIITFITFADNQETPPVVEAMNNYGVRCKLSLKFNNSALSNSKKDEIDELDMAYWRIGCKSLRKCVKALQDLPALSPNTMKSLQNDVYTKQVLDSAERDLRSEIMAYIKESRISKHMSQKAINICESVWDMATALNHLKGGQDSKLQGVENVLLDYVQEVCQKHGENESMTVRMLSLAPSRKLVSTGIGIIQSMAPMYKLIPSLKSKPQVPAHRVPEGYCNKCKRYNHLTEKISYTYVMGTEKVAYHCSLCGSSVKYNGGGQEVYPTISVPDNTAAIQRSMIQHTLDCLIKTVSEHAIEKYSVKISNYVRFLDYITDYQYKDFVRALEM